MAPIVGIVGIALGWMTYKGIEHLGAPEVFLDPYRRSADAWEKYDLKEAQEYHRRTAKQFRHKVSSPHDMASLSLPHPPPHRSPTYPVILSVSAGRLRCQSVSF